MTSDDRVSAILESAKTLSPAHDAAQLMNLYSEAASLVDRAAKPKKWAAFRAAYGRVAYPTNPAETLRAFRDALPCFTDPADHACWTECESYIGWSLFLKGNLTAQEIEEAIEALESSLADYPQDTPKLLYTLYTSSTQGDPLLNWQKRMHYLELSLAQTPRDTNPVEWAKLKNEVAVALTCEPDGDFIAAIEKRIGLHHESLAALEPLLPQADPAALNRWILVSIDTAEAYANRRSGNPADNYDEFIKHARAAYESSNASLPLDTQISATTGYARALMSEDQAPSRDQCLQALAICDHLSKLIDATAKPVSAATNEKFKALAYLRLLKLGNDTALPNLLRHADSAYALVDENADPSLRRVVCQVAADGLLHANDFVRARSYLTNAIESGERALSRATSRSARLEAIFDLHDSYALLAFCHFKTGNIAAGIEALDRGKNRLWRTDKPTVADEQIKALVPASGALLFPVFGPGECLVAIVTEQVEKLVTVEDFGAEQLKALLLAGIASSDSDSWISRYCYRHTHPAEWQNKIESVCTTLFNLFWRPLRQPLSELNIADHAELVLFPQGGLGALPLHAACIEHYAIRYAPSLSSLLHPVQPKPPHTLLVSDPPTDLPPLPGSTLEAAFVRAAESPGQLSILAGVDATKQKVMAALSQAASAHFSTHAQFNIDNPFDSCLFLAGGERLTITDLLPLLKQCPLNEVILSACETGMTPSWRRPDEMLGFPAALLSHGVRVVVSTLWPIDDWASAALIGRFYIERKIAATVAQALYNAQRWLRQVTADELYDLLAPFTAESAPADDSAAEIRTALFALDPASKPFAHPYFWAAFTVSGS